MLTSLVICNLMLLRNDMTVFRSEESQTSQLATCSTQRYSADYSYWWLGYQY